MNRAIKYLVQGTGILAAVIFASVHPFYTSKGYAQNALRPAPDTSVADTGKLRYPYKPTPDYPNSVLRNQGGIFLHYPKNIKSELEYDPSTGKYEFKQKMGKLDFRPSSSLSLDEFRKEEFNSSVKDYWFQKSSGKLAQSAFVPRFNLGGEAFDKIFGSNIINITPQGSAELIFGYNMARTDNPTLSEKLRKTPSFNFDSKIQMNVTGSIGDKLNLGINYNTEATFDFENKTKLEWAGEEDDIIKKVEAGNVTLPLTGSLITGSQSLFGLKTEMQFGKLSVTSIFSQQKGNTSTIDMKGGAQVTKFEVTADNYEANKHFFISQYFREHYNEALSSLPVINSAINITKIEVWVTNKTNNFENARNIIAFTDLGENEDTLINSYWKPIAGAKYPDNESNDLYSTVNDKLRDIASAAGYLNGLPEIINGQDYEKIENARKLSEREYTFNDKLGYISLNTALNADEVLAVAYEYTLNGVPHKVGELSTGGISAPKTLVLKLIKGTNLTPRLPNWKLMMKNIYSLGAYQVSPKEFTLNILYQDDKSGNALNYLPEGLNVERKILLRLLHLDNLNSQLDPTPDGAFDFIEGITINSTNGRIIFPVLEPFGKDLENLFGNDPLQRAIAKKYVFKELYDSTQTKARQIAEKNKFKLQGTYQSSSSSDIPLNAMNVPQGSVVVTAGGMKLTENIDYTVDYALGRVRITKPGLVESGTPIQISLENQSMFAIQTKTLVGTHLDYKFNDDLNIGATVLHLTERPLTQKVNFGDEPISNTIWGLNTSWKTKSNLLTTLVDKLPFIQTKEQSSLSLDAEFAQLLPGSNKAINGSSYIDDFEGSQTSIELKNQQAWSIASTPQGQPGMFPEGSLSNNLANGFNRAKLAWYVIDPLFLRNNSLTPSHLTDNDKSSNFVREVYEKEIWPNKESPNNIPTNIAVLNLAYYPTEKGPYNYDAMPTIFSKGIDIHGHLNDPASRWAGIMREIQTNDFEAMNVEFIEFWMMDPFVETSANNPGGDLYFNLGNVSEDVLRDSRKSFENGLPTPGEIPVLDTTAWGVVSAKQSLTNTFDNDPTTRSSQDVGLDGLNDDKERSFFDMTDSSYIGELNRLYAQGELTQGALDSLMKDPSSDDYHYYRGPDYDDAKVGILDRYKKYNGLENNSPTPEQTNLPYSTNESVRPDVEDINNDNTLSESEAYYQYHVSLRKDDMTVGKNFITDKVTATVTLENGHKTSINWYQFKVPIKDYDRVIGGIQDFKSIRFMRVFMKGFQETTILRFARLELKRGEWRKYTEGLAQGNEGLATGDEAGSLDISAVNIEENSSKDPVNYVLPPGISRVIDPTNPQLRQLNEQSMVLKVENLADGDARAAFKNTELDVRQYKMIKMDVHAEALKGDILRDGDLTAFIRLGTDYKDNYYEYEEPLKVTPPKPASGYSNADGSRDREIVWPDSNQMEINLELLTRAKLARNAAMNTEGSGVTLFTRFPYKDGRKTIYIVGNPTLSSVRTIMIGVRNPGNSGGNPQNDGKIKSGEIWVNELRLTNFNDKSGWAANARAAMKLADLGTISLAGAVSTPGFGSIEKKVAQRSTETMNSYDLSGTFELGKFFPSKSNISIPMFLGYSETFINPEYNPMDPDVLFQQALDLAPNESARKKLKQQAQDYNRRKSINFTNVRFGKASGKPKPWDLNNWSLGYAFTQEDSRDIRIEKDLDKRYTGMLAYSFTMRPKNVTPFKKIKFLKSPALALIRDFNFYYLPSNVSFRTEVNRQYQYTKMRNLAQTENADLIVEPSVYKDFLWNRYYDMKFDITRSLKLDFSATNMARIDEPAGAVDKSNRDEYQVWKDSVMQNIKALGRTVNYHHAFNLQYTVPLNKIPLFSWTSHTLRYGGTYSWEAGPKTADTIQLGNVITNSNKIDFSGQYNLNTLYNKVGFLKRLNEKPEQAKNKKPKEYKTLTYEKTYPQLKGGVPRSVFHQLNSEDVTIKITDAGNKELKVNTEIANANKVVITPDSTLKDVTVTVEAKVEQKENPMLIILRGLGRAIIGVKNVSFSWSQSQGTKLPGYMKQTQWLGLDLSNGNEAPGFPFILGFQDQQFGKFASEHGWLTTDPKLSMPFMTTSITSFSARASIEPLPGMKIDLTANRQIARNTSIYYFYNDSSKSHNFTDGQTITGNFSISIISWRTAFDPINMKSPFPSQVFDAFKSNSVIISERLRNSRVAKSNNYTGDLIAGTPYYEGYSMTSQEVLIPAFFAAYTGRSASSVELTPFPSYLSMLPNWRITYDGLSNIPFIQKYFRSINLNHSYKSSYNVGTYTNNIEYHEESDGLSYVIDAQQNYMALYDVGSVSVSEQLSPLIGVDMTWQSDMTTRFDLKKTRTAALSLSNDQIIEMTTSEVTVGAGYRFDDVQFTLSQPGGGQKQLKSDLNVKADLSIRDSRTMLRQLVEDNSQPSAGQRAVSIKISADYMLGPNFNLRVFFDRMKNLPYVSTSFPTYNTNIGFSLTFSLSQAPAAK